MPCGKESSPRIAIGRKLLTEEPSCEAEDMTAPETFTAASKRPLTTGRRPDMTAICALRPFTAASSNRMTLTHRVGPDPNAVIRIRDRLGAHAEALEPRTC